VRILVPPKLTLAQRVQRLVDAGYTDEEIVDEIRPRKLHDKRILAEAIQSVRRSKPGLTRNEILAARAADIAARGKGGEGAIAKRLSVSESTVHRWREHHGLVPWPKE
jgi:hypothetical protein